MLWVWAAFMFFVGLTGCAAPGTSAPFHTIRSDRLIVTIMDPNDQSRYNRGVRFTPIAAVISAKLDGQNFLFCPDDHHPITDHAGLAAEFDLVTPADPASRLPSGYGEAKMGEGFLKIGVGVLRKQREPYTLFQESEIISLSKTKVHWNDNGAEFRQTSSGVNGYAYELTADLCCVDTRIIVDWSLRNTGKKTLTTRQYSHNFFRFDDRNIGQGYVLSFPYDLSVSGLKAEQRRVGREIHFVAEVPRPTNLRVDYPPNYAGPNICTLRNVNTKQSITCKTSLPGVYTAIHVRQAYVSPEQFIELHLEPGQTKTWRRSYVFSFDAVAK